MRMELSSVLSSLEPFDVHRALLLERLSTWSRLEIRHCGAAHVLPACDYSCVSEEWRGDAASALPEDDAAEVGLQLAAAFESLGRRAEGIAALERASVRAPDAARVRLALAKLLFRSARKEEAHALLVPLLTDAALNVNAATRGDAFYVAGWIQIHRDDHTRAYDVWSEGARHVPTDARLERQRRKAAVWGNICGSGEGGDLSGPLVGAGSFASSLIGVQSFCVPAGRLEPALSLFDTSSGPQAERAVAFVSREAILTVAECASVSRIVDAHIATLCGGAWPTVRNASVPTTDIAVEDVPELVPWLRALMRTRVFPMLEACFPRLAGDGGALSADRIRVHDAFIVRYDAAAGSTLLPHHSDTSVVSASIALNEEGADYAGGGLEIECLRGVEGTSGEGALSVRVGRAAVFAGPLRHGGAEITRGVRLILVLFLFVDGFAYGQLLDTAKAQCEKTQRRSDTPYVVYRETRELMSTLQALGEAEVE